MQNDVIVENLHVPRLESHLESKFIGCHQTIQHVHGFDLVVIGMRNSIKLMCVANMVANIPATEISIAFREDRSRIVWLLLMAFLPFTRIINITVEGLGKLRSSCGKLIFQ